MTAIAAQYIGVPIETDPSTPAVGGHDYLTARWPEYRPSPANFDSGTIDAHARMIAELRDLAANVPDDIFKRIAWLAGLPLLTGTPATLTATITAVDELGYTMEAGTS